MEEKDNKKLIYGSLFLALIFGMGTVGYFTIEQNKNHSKNKYELDSLSHAKLNSLEKHYLFEKDSLDKEYFRNR